MIDVVMPKNNEQSLVEMAERLGYGSICLLYDRISKDASARIGEARKRSKLNVYLGAMKPANDADIVFSDVSKTNAAEAVQARNIDVIYGFENLKAKDRFNQRVSGLDSVLSKMASQKKKVYCVDFNSVLRLKGKQKALVIGRLKQNLMLCRKYKIDVAIASFASLPLKMRNPLDLSAFLAVLGHDSGKKPLETIEKRISLNMKKRSGKIIREGVERA